MKIKILLNSVAILLFLNVSANPISVNDGKTIFTTRCAACHNVNIKVVGPALANVDQRHSIDWIVKFVHSSQTLVKADDKQAVALFKEFNQMIMPDHPDLSEDQVKSVVEFIKSQSKSVSAAESTPFARPGKKMPDYTPVPIGNFAFFGTLLAFIFIMVASLSMAVKIKEIQRQKNSYTGEQLNDIY